MDLRTLTKKEYPPGLREIPQIPKKLYIRGALPPKEAVYLAVVGSRNYTQYGKEACEKIIRELRGSPLVVVSGLALGIDSIAHRAALDAGLLTIAIPGSGLDQKVLYPRTNHALAEKIVDSGGALLSEFEPDFKATPYSFPERNRLMAGIARGILIIEAGEQSGTLITARLGTEYNRDVFVVPGSIFSKNSAGSHWLLKQGAIPVTSGSDVLEHWGLSGEEKDKERKEKIRESCSREEQLILGLLNEPLSKDELAKKSELPINELNVILSVMEIKGLLKETLGTVRISL